MRQTCTLLLIKNDLKLQSKDSLVACFLCNFAYHGTFLVPVYFLPLLFLFANCSFLHFEICQFCFIHHDLQMLILNGGLDRGERATMSSLIQNPGGVMQVLLAECGSNVDFVC